MHINVDEVDADTRRFYERHGFVNIEEGADYRMLCYIGPTRQLTAPLSRRGGRAPARSGTRSAAAAESWIDAGRLAPGIGITQGDGRAPRPARPAGR